MKLKAPSSTPLAHGCAIAIGIAGSQVTHSTTQKHVALIYRKESSNEPWLLHLGWHENLCHEPWNSQYHWLEVEGIDIELQETFADWAVIVAGTPANNNIPYSVIFNPEDNFDSDGQFLNRNDGSGLTCATFLLALFADFSLPLIVTSSWPLSRPGDFTWLRKILNQLRKYVTLPHFMEQVRRRHALQRYRPEEVATAAHIFRGEPLQFAAVDAHCQQLAPLLPI